MECSACFLLSIGWQGWRAQALGDLTGLSKPHASAWPALACTDVLAHWHAVGKRVRGDAQCNSTPRVCHMDLMPSSDVEPVLQGFKNPTDERHCVNSVSIKFKPKS